MTDTKRKIIEAMYELIAEKGYDKTSIQQICDIVNIKKPSVYYYFKNKEEILLEMANLIIIDTVQFVSEYKNIKDKEEFKGFLINLGFKFIDETISDLNYRKVMCELNIQTGRIEQLSNKMLEIEDKTVQVINDVIEHGNKISAFDKSIDTLLYSKMIIVFIDGIESAIEYKSKFDYKEIWKNFILKVFF